METNNRRGFLKSLGLFGAAVSGAAVARTTVDDIKPAEQKPDISHLAPLGLTMLTIQSNNEPPPPPEPGGYSFHQYKHTHSVNLSVGKDNRLWIEVDGQWRRIALETQ